MVTNETVLRIVNLSAIVLLVCALTLSGYTLAEYFAARDAFRFGTEVAGWRYATKWHYVGAAVGEGIFALLGIIGGYALATLKARAVLRGVVVLVLAVEYLV